MAYLQEAEKEFREHINGFEPEIIDYSEGAGEPRLTLTDQFVESLIEFMKTKLLESYKNGMAAAGQRRERRPVAHTKTKTSR